jgi:inorganic pyrophosphatase
LADLLALSNNLYPKRFQCRAIIETPKNRRNKFDYDPKSTLFKLGGLLPEGMMFPFDFGFIPATVGGDGDPLDVMVLMDEPAHVGCLVDIRIIGVIQASQTEKGKTETNDRLLAVSVHSYSHENISSIEDLNLSMLEQIERFLFLTIRCAAKSSRSKASMALSGRWLSSRTASRPQETRWRLTPDSCQANRSLIGSVY